MNRKRRLVFVWNYLSWGGAQVYFLAIMKLAKENWDIIVHLPAASPPEIIEYVKQVGASYDLVDHHLDHEPANGLVRKIERQLNRIKVEYRTFRTLLKYDVRSTVFQIEVAPWQSVTFLTAMALRGAKVFLTLHNFLPEASSLRKAVWTTRLRYVSYLPGVHFFTSNVDTKTRLRGLVSERFWERIKVTYTAVDPPQIDEALAVPFDRARMLTAHGIRPDSFIVLCVGQFIDRKGRWVFLEAARQILGSQNDAVTFVWLTPQMPSAKEQKKITSYGLGDKLRIVHSPTLGKERVDVLSFFRIADVFALPSYVEGLPIALLEAMALKLPSISTDVYAIPEAVKHLKTGILIEAGDSDALAKAILKLKADPNLRARLSADGRKFVIENFDERDAAATAIAAYEEALG
ncbi:MAG: glycosyltransferase family 4 protein [Acidobacteriota bacterium]